MTTHTPSPKVSTLYPAWIAQELMFAAAVKDHRLIDQITDRLVLLGLVRPRGESGVFTTQVGVMPA